MIAMKVSNSSIGNSESEKLNYFEWSVQLIFDTVKTTDDLVLWVLISVLICVGILVNLLVIRSMWKIKCNGTHYLLLQIVIADLLSLVQIKWDVFYISHRSWLDSIEWCPIYLGVDTFSSTALAFFIIALNFHTISTYNLACKTIEKNHTKQLQQQNYEAQILQNEPEDSDEFDEFDDCDSFTTIEETTPDTSTQTDSHQRSIVIDYSKPKKRISVLLPVISIWLLAISMCIPLFLFGRIIPTQSRNSNERMCGLVVIDRSISYILQFLLVKMRIIMPTLCLVLSTIYVIIKLWMAKRKTAALMIANALDEDSVQILKLALSISISYMLCSMQRIYGSLWFELIYRPMMEYKYAQFPKWLAISGCIIHYAAIIVRPILYGRFERLLGRDMKKRCCCCS